MIKLGIVGAGFGAKVQLPAFTAIEGVQVVGLIGRDANRSREIAEANKLPNRYEDWQSLVADPSVDAISVATPPSTQREVVLATLAQGKHVLCEKPFGLNSVEARLMHEAALQATCMHSVDYLFRFSETRQQFKQALSLQKIGQAQRAQFSWQLPGRACRVQPWAWQFDLEAGGGALLNLASHALDAIEWLLGPIVEVKASLTHQGPAPEGCIEERWAEDTVELECRLQDGVLVQLDVSNANAAGEGLRFSVYGDAGALHEVNTNTRDVVVGTQLFYESLDGAREAFEMSRMDDVEDGRVLLFQEMAAQFVNAAEQGTSKDLPTFDTGVRIQALMEAIRVSDTSGEWVAVPREPMRQAS